MRVRRSAYVFLTVEDGPQLDLGALLRGRVETGARPGLRATSILTGETHPLTREELDALLSVPADGWVPHAGEIMVRLVERGLVVTDERDGLSRREELLAAHQWHPAAALQHALTREHGLDVAPALEVLPEIRAEEGADELIARHGLPPPHFHRVEAQAVHELPLARRTDGLYGLLARRRTTRSYDASRPVTEDQLATLLDTVFGAHGCEPLPRGIALLRKTSPSSGALHPIEAYPLVANVEGVEAGLYHYAVERHALELVSAVERAELGPLVAEFTGGQSYFADAHVLVVLTARFFRRFWKYRRQERGYSAIHLEAGHLSQTFYLVATELGLGAFVTVAINAGSIEDRLGLEPFEEGVIAVLGCGPPGERSPLLEPEPEPYEPRR